MLVRSSRGVASYGTAFLARVSAELDKRLGFRRGRKFTGKHIGARSRIGRVSANVTPKRARKASYELIYGTDSL